MLVSGCAGWPIEGISREEAKSEELVICRSGCIFFEVCVQWYHKVLEVIPQNERVVRQM